MYARENPGGLGWTLRVTLNSATLALGFWFDAEREHTCSLGQSGASDRDQGGG